MYTDNILPELQLRWKKVQQFIQADSTDGLLIGSNPNLYYVSGRVFSGYCYLPASGDPFFFVRRPVGLTGENLFYIRKPEQIIEILTAHRIRKPRRLMLETDTVPYNECIRYRNIFEPEEIRNGSSALHKARTVKTLYEIEQTRISGIHHDAMYKRITSVYKEGMTDTEFSIELERLARLHGSLGIIRIAGSSMELFMGSVLCGENADRPSPYDFAMGGAGMDLSLPVGCNGSIIRPGNAIMVDIGGNFTGYMTDMSRVFSLGQLPEIALKAHQTSIDIQTAIERTARPGTAAADLYQKAAEIATEAGLASYFMGHKQQAGFIGHGVGIELNESPVLAPRSKDILATGMVFALEPKFVVPNVGAVGVENTFVVTDNGIEKLTHSPEQIISLT